MPLIKISVPAIRRCGSLLVDDDRPTEGLFVSRARRRRRAPIRCQMQWQLISRRHYGRTAGRRPHPTDRRPAAAAAHRISVRRTTMILWKQNVSMTGCRCCQPHLQSMMLTSDGITEMQKRLLRPSVRPTSCIRCNERTRCIDVLYPRSRLVS